MFIISKLFSKKTRYKDDSDVTKIGNYEIRKFRTGTYAVYNKKDDIFIGRNLKGGLWSNPEFVHKYCTVSSLEEAKDILYKIADRGEPV